MADPSIFLIFAGIIIAVIIIAVGFVSLIKFQHPDDKNQAWLPKIVVILSFFVLFGSAMLMPFDVLNREVGANLNLDVMWIVALCIVAAFCFIVLPFSFFYYENDIDDIDGDGKKRSCCNRQCGPAIGYTLAMLVVILILSIVLYATPANTAIVPVHRIVQGADQLVPICDSVAHTPAPYAAASATFATACAKRTGKNVVFGGCTTNGMTFNLEISVSWPVYLMALLAFIGWWFFFLFAGVGLISLPMGLINDYRTRPKPMGKSRYNEECTVLSQRADFLLEKAKSVRDGSKNQAEPKGFWAKRAAKQNTMSIHELENDFYTLRRDFDLLKISYEFSKSNPLFFFLKLVLGILGIIISLCWIIHIGLFILPGRGNEVDPFLNTFFDITQSIGDGYFPLFGVIFYAIFVFYLMWCTIHGNQTFGIRLLIFRVFPMEVGNTMMNAFIANLWILMFCIFPLIQFTAQAFPMYSRYTSIQALFGAQVRYLKGFEIFWKHSIFVIMMLGMAGITLLYKIICPGSRKKKLQAQLDERIAQRERRI